MSSDRLFRVRNKQPYSSDSSKPINSTENEHCALPTIATTVSVGQFCVFKAGEGSDKWSVGKILQFAKLGKSVQQFKNSSVNPSLPDIGVLCSWFESQKGSTRHFKLFENPGITHTFIPTSLYVCTLNNCCVQARQHPNSPVAAASILPKYTRHQQKLVTATEFTLTAVCESFINDQIVTVKNKPLPDVIVVDSASETSVSNSKSSSIWKKINYFHLYYHDKEILLSDTEWLNDNHMTCAQMLLKSQFPQYGGLQCTVLQQSIETLKPLLPNSLQIVHSHGNHWIAISTVNCETGTDLCLYDSSY